MVFTTPIFLFYFLPAVLGVYYVLPRGGRNLFLTLASYVFYGWWNPWFVTLMLTSTLIDWFCGVAIAAPGASASRRRLALTASIAANGALLGFFKYFVFAQENLNRLLELFGRESFDVLRIVLPVGISFYTFQSVSYTIDLYRGHARRARTILDFSCFVALFPQLIAGPIVRYRDLADQLRERPQRAELFAEGALTFMVGFAKKILLSNYCAEIADIAFEAEALPWHVAWVGVSAAAFHYYYDFSGYSDMAIGLGAMFGFRLPINFRSPLRSGSITEFWRRWHVSLSTWLRDYLYISLGGNRKGQVRTYANLLAVMIFGGLWHGAGWTYLVWGLAHGAVLAVERMLDRDRPYKLLPRWLQIVFTFHLLFFCWILFKVDTLGEAGAYFRAIACGQGGEAAGMLTAGRAYQPFYLVVLAIAALVTWTGVETEVLVQRALRRLDLVLGVFLLFVVAMIAMYAQAENPFIYFRF